GARRRAAARARGQGARRSARRGRAQHLRALASDGGGLRALLPRSGRPRACRRALKLAFVTQELDPDHPALAQTVDLVRALATRVERLEVATRRVRTAVPPNAAVYTFDAGSRPGRVVSFERAILRATRSVDAVVVHMVPEFALLSAPVCK